MGRKSGWVIGVAFCGLVAWGVGYTWAFAQMQGEVQEARAEVAAVRQELVHEREIAVARVVASRQLVDNLSQRHDVLLTYVITLREQLARTGFQVPRFEQPEENDDHDGR